MKQDVIAFDSAALAQISKVCYNIVIDTFVFRERRLNFVSPELAGEGQKCGNQRVTRSSLVTRTVQTMHDTGKVI